MVTKPTTDKEVFIMEIRDIYKASDDAIKRLLEIKHFDIQEVEMLCDEVDEITYHIRKNILAYYNQS